MPYKVRFSVSDEILQIWCLLMPLTLFCLCPIDKVSPWWPVSFFWKIHELQHMLQKTILKYTSQPASAFTICLIIGVRWSFVVANPPHQHVLSVFCIFLTIKKCGTDISKCTFLQSLQEMVELFHFIQKIHLVLKLEDFSITQFTSVHNNYWIILFGNLLKTRLQHDFLLFLAWYI